MKLMKKISVVRSAAAKDGPTTSYAHLARMSEASNSCMKKWHNTSGWLEHSCCEVCKTEYRFQRVHECKFCGSCRTVEDSVRRGRVLGLCAQVAQSCIVQVLFVSGVVLSIRFGHLINPGAMEMVLSEPAQIRAVSSTHLNNSDTLLLLVYGFSVPALLFRLPLQTAVCCLVKRFIPCAATLPSLGHILASAVPSPAARPPSRAAVAADAALPPETLDIAGLIDKAPRGGARWHLVHFRQTPPKAFRRAAPCRSAHTTGVHVGGEAGSAAGDSVPSAFYWSVTACPAFMPLPKVGVFRYCTGAVCCVLALRSIRFI